MRVVTVPSTIWLDGTHYRLRIESRDRNHTIIRFSRNGRNFKKVISKSLKASEEKKRAV